MPRRKQWDELSENAQAQYTRVIERAYGKRAPTYVPEIGDWPESSRASLRAALQAYWSAKGDEAKGLLLSRQIKKTKAVQHVRVWPSLEDAELWLKTAEHTEPRAAYLLAKICMKRGLRSEEVLSTPRVKWEAGVRYGKFKFIGKGSKERVLQVDNIKRTIQELLDMPGNLPHDGALAAKFDAPPQWTVPGELLARPGSTFGTQHNLFARYIKKVAKAAGLDPTQWKPHAMRHVFSDRYMADGGNERGLQIALGHASIETITRYTHPTPEAVGRVFRGD